MTRFNCVAGAAIIPTLARIVLALAFITVGAHKLFNETTLDEDQAAILQDEYGITVRPLSTPLNGQDNDALDDAGAYLQPSDSAFAIIPAGLRVQEEPAADDPADQQDRPATDPQNAAEQDEPDDDFDVDDEVQEAAEELEETVEEAAEEVVGETTENPGADQPQYAARAMYAITLMLHQQGIQYPVVLTWVLALTEFVGGILILIGLFSRIWALGLAIAMAVAFVMTSMEPYFSPSIIIGPFEAARGEDGHMLFNRVFSQLGLCVLALSVLLAGAGPLSFDRLIFRSRSHNDEHIHLND